MTLSVPLSPHPAESVLRFAADQLRWEKEVEQYEHRYPHYRSHLAQKHVKKLNDKGIIDIQLSQLGIKKPFTARHYYIKEQVEVSSSLVLTPCFQITHIQSSSRSKRASSTRLCGPDSCWVHIRTNL